MQIDFAFRREAVVELDQEFDCTDAVLEACNSGLFEQAPVYISRPDWLVFDVFWMSGLTIYNLFYREDQDYLEYERDINLWVVSNKDNQWGVCKRSRPKSLSDLPKDFRLVVIYLIDEGFIENPWIPQPQEQH